MSCTHVPPAHILLATLVLVVLPVHRAQGQEGYRPSAPGEIISDESKSRRQFVVGDMMRIRLVSAVEQGSRGILKVEIGETFHTSPARDLYFSKLSNAYFEWAYENRPLTIELWDQGTRMGEYRNEAFLMSPEYADRAGCSPDQATGLCAVTAMADSGRPAPARPGQPRPAVQTASRHSGFHLTAGLGGGSAGLSCDRCRFSRETAFSGYLALARSVARNALLGIEGTVWAEGGDHQGQVYSLMGQVTGYPNGTSGLFATVGVGLLGYRENTDLGDLRASGLGASGRLGYEIRAGRSLLITPYLGYLRTLGGAGFSFNGVDVGDYDISNFQFGLAIGVN